MFMINMPCAVCAEVRQFEQPPCFERHEPACPEWACITCGTAVLLDPPLRLLVAGRARLPRQRQRRLAA